MKFSTFAEKNINTLSEPLFLGNSVNISRYDIQKYPIFEKLIDRQLSFFWRPEEIDLSRDRKDFITRLEPHEKHIFLENLKYQILLDSVQGRSPNIALLPLASLPELETWIETWSFSETIHSRSYTHIIRNVIDDPATVFDTITATPEIIERAKSVTKHYDDLIEYAGYYNLLGEGKTKIIDPQGKEKIINISKRELKKKIYLTVASVNVLEAIRFYVSFACAFSFSERNLMEGNAKVIKLIARDENLHLSSTQHLINIMKGGSDDPEMGEIAKECEQDVINLFLQAAQQEKDWAEYLFKDGSVLGLNVKILSDYIEYLTDTRLKAIGLEPLFGQKYNPIPWINGYLSSDNVQVAPQETEITSYRVGQIDATVETEDFDFEL